MQHGWGVTQCSKFFPSILWECSAFIFSVTASGSGECSSGWEEGSVSCVARSDIMWPIKSPEGEEGEDLY